MDVVNLISAELDARPASGATTEESRRLHIRLVIAADTAAAAVAALGALAWHSGGSDAAGFDGAPIHWIMAAIAPLWIVSVWMCGGYGRTALTLGVDQYRRVGTAAVSLVAVFSVLSLLIDSTALFRHEVIAAALAAAVTPVLRVAGVRAARRRRLLRNEPRRALLVGQASAISDFLDHHRDPSGIGSLEVIATYVTDPPAEAEQAPSPAHGTIDGVPEMVRRTGSEIVIALSSPELDGDALRRLSWRLRELNVDLALAPILAAVAADRIAVGSFGGMPLLHIRPPVLSGPGRFVKELAERALALLLIVLFSPLMLALAVVVRATSPGPALFRQQRVGVGGTNFTCLKFRTMVVNAEQLRAQLEHLNEKHDGLLFKIQKDPRLTRIGAVLRHYSLDELPQLFNVLGGSMSLIGPRPPLPAEVAKYNEEVFRRLYVKPGLTGLWQISGRSSLSWAESVRLDLNYVENWSPALDASILLRTTSAVVRGTGAF